jgi:hypothetical protein
MATIALPHVERPAHLILWLVRAGLMPGLLLVLCLVLVQFEASKECRGGAFSAGFSRGFDIRSCDLVIRRFGRDIGLRVPLM